MTLSWRALDARAAEFVASRLSARGPFCETLLEVVSGSAGEFFTLAPEGTPETRLYEFELSGLLPENLDLSRAVVLPEGGSMLAVTTLYDERAAFLLEEMRGGAGRVCVANDHVCYLEQKWWSDATFAAGAWTYSLLTPDLDADAIADELSEVAWMVGVAAVTARAPMVVDRQASDEEMIKSARDVLVLTCTAYDTEGFVGWRRLGAASP